VPRRPYTEFHSQNGEDRFLVEGGYLPERGTFVDVGAGQPVALSNTYHLERNGWTGLCVDADPRQVARLRRTRRCAVEHAAVTASGAPAVLFQCKAPEFSTTLDHLPKQVRHSGLAYAAGVPVATITVPGARLESLLRRHAIEKIDLLSVDTEGSEVDVLRSLEWERHWPSVVIVEHVTWYRGSNEKPVRRHFSRLPYEVAWRTRHNLIFVMSGGPPRAPGHKSVPQR
jgi:FkbM family methyltransferase